MSTSRNWSFEPCEPPTDRLMPNGTPYRYAVSGSLPGMPGLVVGVGGSEGGAHEDAVRLARCYEQDQAAMPFVSAWGAGLGSA